LKTNLKNCWKYIKCPKTIRENCETYTERYGNECWLLPKYNLKGCPALLIHASIVLVIRKTNPA